MDKKKNADLAYLPAQLWNQYVIFAKKATARELPDKREDIFYWRDKLFTKFIIYLLPLCFIALVPCLIVCLKAGYVNIAVFNVITVLFLAVISLNAKLDLNLRKALVILSIYIFSIALIITLSLLGPGLIYLLGLSVLTAIILPKYWAYLSVVANALICICCAVIIQFKLFGSPLTADYNLGGWIAVSSNVLFLSLVIVILLSNTIKGLEKAIAMEIAAKGEQQQENKRRKEINELLTESENNYKSLFSQSPSPLWVLDTVTLQFLQVNDAAVQQYGYSQEEFLLINITDIKMASDIHSFYEDLQKSRSTGLPLSVTTQHKRKNGERFYAEVTFNTIMFNGRAATLGISRDITEQVTYVKAIEQQNEKFREIAWIQSHMVRGPVATILGLTQLFNDKDIEISTEEIIAGIVISSDKLDKVIKEIVSKSSVADIETSPVNVQNSMHVAGAAI